jgi:hypothetical protein
MGDTAIRKILPCLPGNFPRERRIFAISTLFVHSLFTSDGMETKFLVSMNDVPVAGALQKLLSPRREARLRSIDPGKSCDFLGGYLS